MTYIFLDESGDLGFDFTNHSTSKYFVIALLVTSNPNPIEKIVKKLAQQIHRSGKKVPSNFHAYNDSDVIRKYILNHASQKDIKIYTLVLDKTKSAQPSLQVEYYNQMVKQLLLKVMQENQGSFILIASKRETKKKYNELFISEVQSIAKQHNQNVETHLIQHFTNKCLQVIDFISWSTFKKWEQKKPEFYNLVKEKIVFEELIRL